MSPKVVGIGEVLWDLLPGGKQLGGAPANFVYHTRALGAEACLISRVGNDPAGREALERLAGLGIPTQAVEVDGELPTGSVSVELLEDGQPQFTIHENVAWDALQEESSGRQAMAAADAVCFGTLAQRSARSRETIRGLLATAPPNTLLILDVNLREPFFSDQLVVESLQLADVLKLNETELPFLAEVCQLRGDERSQIMSLADDYGLNCVAYTRGARGSLLYAQGEWAEQAGVKVEVVDTVGAGDAFTAALCLGLLAGWELGKIHSQASQLAAYVCSQAGATPPIPLSFREAFEKHRKSLPESKA